MRELSKYLNVYTHEHYVMAKRVLRYLRGTRMYGLVIEKGSTAETIKIDAYADADLGSDAVTRRSVSGYVIQVDGNTVAYKNKQQTLVAENTCAAEFVAASMCASELTRLHNMCIELGIKREQTVLHQDNTSTITVLSDCSKTFKVTSVDLKYHKVRQQAAEREFDVQYCASEDMVADVFTKPLGAMQFAKLRERLGVVDVEQLKHNSAQETCAL